MSSRCANRTNSEHPTPVHLLDFLPKFLDCFSRAHPLRDTGIQCRLPIVKKVLDELRGPFFGLCRSFCASASAASAPRRSIILP